jgi:putative hydrolase of the HAD superfamily
LGINLVVVFDLDDTLCDEIEFIKSGFLAVAKSISRDEFEPLFSYMLKSFYKNGSGKVFNDLIDEFQLDVKLERLIDVYRFHKPYISLSLDREIVLKYIKQNFKTALISDGHYLMQSNKFDALYLDRYIDYPIFTDRYNTSKPDTKAFELVMNRFSNETNFCYISDNPKKDFIAPNLLGWDSIRFKNPNGIYRDFPNSAKIEIDYFIDILDIFSRVKSK